jgi:cytochrome P450
LYELHRHPAILAEVRAEVDQAFAQGVPTPEVLKSMERLNSTIMETLRLHPSAFGMVRTANRDFEFEGCKVKKGQDVVILTTATHMMEENFPSPQRFDIDRYSAPRNEHRKRSVYAPFGRGPHTCLGAGMSDVMMALALGSILYQYEFDIIDPTLKFKERIGPTPSLGRAFKLRLKACRH